jgi:hypothetical protein
VRLDDIATYSNAQWFVSIYARKKSHRQRQRQLTSQQ